MPGLPKAVLISLYCVPIPVYEISNSSSSHSTYAKILYGISHVLYALEPNDDWAPQDHLFARAICTPSMLVPSALAVLRHYSTQLIIIIIKNLKRQFIVEDVQLHTRGTTKSPLLILQ